MKRGVAKSGLTYEQYDALPGVRWSRLKAMRVSPRQYQYEVSQPSSDTAFFRVGKAMHAFVLETDTFLDRHVAYEGTRRGKAWDEFLEANAGRAILSVGEMAHAVGAGHAILSDPVAGPYVVHGEPEKVLTWTDSETGLACKARVDLLNGHLVDLKSTHQIAPRLFATQVARLGYDGQMAFYEDGIRACGLRSVPEPIIIAVQSEPPHDVVTYVMPTHVVDRGRKECRRLLALLKTCIDRNEWPGVAGGQELQLELPEWCFAGDELELTMGGHSLGEF